MRAERVLIAQRRIQNILRSHTVASARILEQKISDAGPNDQRIDPHILTTARNLLIQQNLVVEVTSRGVPWYHLKHAPPKLLSHRFKLLTSLHWQTQANDFVMRVGQTLEIAVFRALRQQHRMDFFGAFLDLEQHDDSSLYRKEEPPSTISGRSAPGNKKVDFLVVHQPVTAAIEVKNVREWFYPDREEIRELLLKCCALDVVPILVARRIHYSTYSVLNPCGLLIHQTFNQRYPASEGPLAAQASRKDLLGYHDIRLGNEPDARLCRFIASNLPSLLPQARQRFSQFKDLLAKYANGDHSYKSFAARVKCRLRGEPEDLPEAPQGEPESEYE